LRRRPDDGLSASVGDPRAISRGIVERDASHC